jgi:hypothetical protein
MAQTKTRNSRSSSSPGRSKSGSKSSSRSGSTSKTRSRGASASSGSKRNTTARKRQTTSNKSTMGAVAEKAKGPALAGGAALVGLAGGMALRNGRKRGVLERLPTPSVKLPKLSMPDIKPDSALKSIGKAAGELAQRSPRVGDVAAEVEKASNAASKKS